MLGYQVLYVWKQWCVWADVSHMAYSPSLAPLYVVWLLMARMASNSPELHKPVYETSDRGNRSDLQQAALE